MPRNKNKTSPQTAEAKMRASKALELRMEGKTFASIAAEAGYNSPQAAHDAVRRALLEVIREPAEDLIKLELERLDVLWGIQFLNAQGGDVQAMSACMKLMERRARLLGLDAPERRDVKAEVSTRSGVLIVPAPIDADVWAEAASKQQAELATDE